MEKRNVFWFLGWFLVYGPVVFVCYLSWLCLFFFFWDDTRSMSLLRFFQAGPCSFFPSVVLSFRFLVSVSPRIGVVRPINHCVLMHS